jgi:hypothetical protein
MVYSIRPERQGRLLPVAPYTLTSLLPPAVAPLSLLGSLNTLLSDAIMIPCFVPNMPNW